MSASTVTSARKILELTADAEAGAGIVAKRMEPRKITWKLNLADHQILAAGMEAMLFQLGGALEHEGSAIRGRYGATGQAGKGSDLDRAFCTAAAHVRDGARKAQSAAGTLRRHLWRPELEHITRTVRRPPTLAAVNAAMEAVEQVAACWYDCGIPVAAHAEVTESLAGTVASLGGALSHEAILVDGAYQSARRPRLGGDVSGDLAGASRDLAAGRLSLRVALVVLGDDAAGGRS